MGSWRFQLIHWVTSLQKRKNLENIISSSGQGVCFLNLMGYFFFVNINNAFWIQQRKYCRNKGSGTNSINKVPINKCCLVSIRNWSRSLLNCNMQLVMRFDHFFIFVIIFFLTFLYTFKKEEISVMGAS